MDVQLFDCEKYSLKPDIRMGNYYLQWNTDGLGVCVYRRERDRETSSKIYHSLRHLFLFSIFSTLHSFNCSELSCDDGF